MPLPQEEIDAIILGLQRMIGANLRSITLENGRRLEYGSLAEAQEALLFFQGGQVQVEGVTRRSRQRLGYLGGKGF